ncbi:MAG TPA: hypothetical protein VK716_11370 [Terracidiphilus sp.]|nr:hypothetical protein [Terracidiphilus sp.]
MAQRIVTVSLQEDTAKILDTFIQDFLPTHVFQPANAVPQIRAFNELHQKLREALDDLG